MAKMKIKKTTFQIWLLITILFDFFEPLYIAKVEVFHLIAQGLTLISVVYLLYKLKCKNNQISPITKSTIPYLVFIVITTFINNNMEFSTIRVLLSILCVAISFNVFGFSKMRKALFSLFSIMITTNLMLHFFANGYIESVVGIGGWFLSGSNALIVYTFPAICVSIMSYDLKEGRIIPLLVIAECIYTSVLSDTATSIFALLVVVILWVSEKIIKKNLLNIKTGVVVIALVFILVVILRIQTKSSIISYIVVDLLQRDLDFTSRTFIWNESIKQFLNAPLFGHGFGYSFHVMVSSVGFWADHAHNQYLQQLVQGGVIQFCLFTNIFIKLIKEIKKQNNLNSITVTVPVIVLGIIFLFESYTNAVLYSLIYLFYHYCRYLRSSCNSESNAPLH